MFDSNKIKLLGFVVIVMIACNTKRHNRGDQYKMVSYESKAEVSTEDFPLIKFFPNNTFEVWQRDSVVLFGAVEKKSDSLLFVGRNGKTLYGHFLDESKKKLRLFRLVDIRIEAAYGDFKKVD